MTLYLNGTTGVSGVDGSAGTPSLQGNDTNTGIVFGTDTVGVSTGGVQRTTVDSSGRLLVGTSSTSANATALFAGNPSGNYTALYLSAKTTSFGTNDNFANIYFTDSGHTVAASIQCGRDGGTWTSGSSQPTKLVFSTTADGTSSPTERMRITNNGTVIFTAGTVGQAFTNNETAFYNDGGFGQGLRFGNTYGHGKGYAVFTTAGATVGSISAQGSTGTAYITTSDYRLKENVIPVPNAIARLQQLNPSRFNFISEPNRTVDGFLAHEAQAIVPECATGEKDEVDADGNPVYQGIDQSKLVPLLTAALQEAIAKIEQLETRISNLEVTP